VPRGVLLPRGSGLDQPLSIYLMPFVTERATDMDYPMHPELKVGNTFPDFELPDHDDKPQKLSKLIRGFPTVLIFSRGYY